MLKDIIASIAASGLPAELRAHLARAAAARSPSEAKAALRRGAADYLAEVAGQLRTAAAVLGQSPDETCRATGFNPNDLGPARFDAMLAELRAVLWLKGSGYAGIKLLPQGSAPCADISARLADNIYFFEVRRLRPDPDLLKDEEYIKEKVYKKMRQVKTSCKKHGGHCGGVILVIKGTCYLIKG